MLQWVVTQGEHGKFQRCVVLALNEDIRVEAESQGGAIARRLVEIALIAEPRDAIAASRLIVAACGNLPPQDQYDIMKLIEDARAPTEK